MSNSVSIEAPDGLPFIDIIREFDHPVDQVFAAYQDPDLVRQWIGPRGYEMDIEAWDFVSGGRYRYIHHTPDHGSFAFRGTFHTVRPPEFAIQTFEFEDVPDVVSIESMTLEPIDGTRTRMLVHAVYPTLEARDGMVASGMELGVREGYEQLDELLARSS